MHHQFPELQGFEEYRVSRAIAEPSQEKTRTRHHQSQYFVQAERCALQSPCGSPRGHKASERHLTCRDERYKELREDVTVHALHPGLAEKPSPPKSTRPTSEYGPRDYFRRQLPQANTRGSDGFLQQRYLLPSGDRPVSTTPLGCEIRHPFPSLRLRTAAIRRSQQGQE